MLPFIVILPLANVRISFGFVVPSVTVSRRATSKCKRGGKARADDVSVWPGAGPTVFFRGGASRVTSAVSGPTLWRARAREIKVDGAAAKKLQGEPRRSPLARMLPLH